MPKNNKPNINDLKSEHSPFKTIAAFLSSEDLKKMSLTSLSFFHTTTKIRESSKMKALIDLFDLFKQIAYFLIENEADIYSKIPKRLITEKFELNDEIIEKIVNLNRAIGDDTPLLAGKLNMMITLTAAPLISYLKNNADKFLIPTDHSDDVTLTREEFYKKCIEITALIKHHVEDGYCSEISSLGKISSVITDFQKTLHELFVQLFNQTIDAEEVRDLSPLQHLLNFAIDINHCFDLKTFATCTQSVPIVALAIAKADDEMICFCLKNKAEISNDVLFYVFHHFDSDMFASLLDYANDTQLRKNLCIHALDWANLKALKMIHEKFPLLIQQTLDAPPHSLSNTMFTVDNVTLKFIKFMLNFKLSQNNYNSLLYRAASAISPSIIELLLKHNDQAYSYPLDLARCINEAARVGNNLHLNHPSRLRKVLGWESGSEKAYAEVVKLLENRSVSMRLTPA